MKVRSENEVFNVQGPSKLLYVDTLPSIFFSPSSIPQGTQTTRITSINSYILPASTQDIRKATDDSGSFGTIRAL